MFTVPSDVYSMQRSEDGLNWSLFDPVEVPALSLTYGDAFKLQYETYEASGCAVTVIPARDLWAIITRAQEESGVPFIMYSDAINGEYMHSCTSSCRFDGGARAALEKNNQSHLGVVQTSNLCTEIVQYSSGEHTAVCTLASVALPRFVRADGSYDFEGLHAVTKLAVRGADSLIDAADYPTDEAMESALQTRAIGVGGQGLADVFMASGMPFASSQARSLNIAIYETIYHAAYEVSCELAQQRGCYPLYSGSPASSGRLQHDMWVGAKTTGRYDFDVLRTHIVEHGLRNSMLTAQMPTATTAKLLGNFDGVEPYSR